VCYLDLAKGAARCCRLTRVLARLQGKWRSDTVYTKPPFPSEWDWKVHEEAGGAGASGRGSAAWVRSGTIRVNNALVCDFSCLTFSVQTDSTAFYDSLFANASTWGLMTAKHDHVSDNIPAVPVALEELGYLGRVLTAEHDGLVRS